MEGEGEDEEDIDDFIDSELNVVKVLTSEVEDGTENILEPEYSEEHQRIARYLVSLQKPTGMSRSEFREFKRKALRYLVQGSHLFRRQGRNIPLRRVIDSLEERKRIMSSLHEESGHRGREGTYNKIAQRYWWVGLYEDVKKHVKTCGPCQFRDPKRRIEELHPTWVSILWEKVVLDAVHMPPNQGKNFIVEARCDLSGWIEARALASLTAESIAKFLYEDVVCRHGCFPKLVYDGGPENKGVVKVLADMYNVRIVLISPYNPPANGAIEVGHRPIKDALSKMTMGGSNQGTEGWVPHLPAVLLADRTTVRTSTGITPFRMLYGWEAVLPIELDVPTWQTLPWQTVRTRADLLAMRARQIERRDQDIEEARAHLQRMREQGKEQYERAKEITRKNPKKGDLVLLHDTKLKTSFATRDKMKFRWLGPYRVRGVNEEKGTYWLEELDGTPFGQHFHGNRLKKFWLRNEGLDVPVITEATAGDEWMEETNSEIEEEQRQEDENDAKWIPPGREFAVVI